LAYIVSSLQYFLNTTVHVVVIQSHEQRIDDNTECDEQLNEWIKHDPRDPLLKFKPAPATVPNAERVDAFESRFNHFLFHGWSILFVLFFCGEVVDRHWRVHRRGRERRKQKKLLKNVSPIDEQRMRKTSSWTKKFVRQKN
jgi:hypothetical protein